MMHKSYNIVYKTPPIFNERTICEFFRNVSSVFNMKGQEVPNVSFNIATPTKDINLLGLLMIYKFLDYTVKNSCFKDPVCNYNEDLLEKLREYSFYDLVTSCFKNKPANYNDLRYRERQDLFIAPIALDRQSEDETSRDVNIKICRYYNYNVKIQFIILTCISEIISNFSAHADNETKSVLVATGNKKRFELACADNGVGIVSNLRSVVKSSFPKMSNFDILSKSIEKGVTSMLDENSGHMGYGLWMINKFVSGLNGEFYLFSEGAYLHNHQGKIRKGHCSNWQGTVIYLSLPLDCLNKISQLLINLNNL